MLKLNKMNLETKFKFNNKGWFANIVVVIIALVLLAGAGVGYFAVKKQKTVDRLVYKNDQYGFSLEFPESWKGYVVNTETNDWGGSIGQSEAILFGFPAQKDLFVIYPFPLAKIQEFKINKLNPIDSLGPVDYTAENSQYVFYRQTAQDVVNADMVEKMSEVGSVLATFKTFPVAGETAGWKTYRNDE